jgi:hypothetical protein
MQKKGKRLLLRQRVASPPLKGCHAGVSGCSAAHRLEKRGIFDLTPAAGTVINPAVNFR